MTQSCSTVPVDLLQNLKLGLVRPSRLRTLAYDNRLDSLRILYKHPIQNVTTPISCMDIDRTENAFLLCGGISGKLYLSNLYVSDFYGPGHKEDLPMPATFRHKNFVTGCQWFHDIRLFVSVSSGGDLTAWDLTNLSELETYNVCETGKWRPQLHWNEIDRTNPLIAVTNGSNQIPLYDLRVGYFAQALRSKGTSLVRAVRWLPNKHHILFSGNDDGAIAVWDIRSNRSALLWKTLSKGNCIRAMRLTSDGAHVVMVLYSGTVMLYDSVTMERLGSFEFRDHRKWSEKMSNSLDQFAICDEGSSIRVALPVGEDIEWISFSKGFREEPRVSHCSTLSGHLSRVNACVHRNGSQQLYSAGADRNVLCWAPESERNRLHLEIETAKASAISSDWSDDD
uniref:WD_REPEATS_REGION domain-containing protein n=1 Tax=Haemonchus contortus TaxID=6289 RepID=A0A7I5E6X0_HAECO